jgi:hypothetical protein
MTGRSVTRSSRPSDLCAEQTRNGRKPPPRLSSLTFGRADCIQTTIRNPPERQRASPGSTKPTIRRCYGDGGCAASNLTFTGKAGKVKLTATAKLGPLDDGKPATARSTLPAKTLKALAFAHVRRLELAVAGAGRPGTVAVTFKRE